MPSRTGLGWCWLSALAAMAACGGDGGVTPPAGPPARLEALTDLSRSAAVGSAITDGIIVRVSDAAGHAVTGVAVAFAVTLGNASTNPRVAMTDSKGQGTAT